MRVHDIEFAGRCARGKEAILERATHIPSFADEIAIVVDVAAMYKDAVALFIMLLPSCSTREEVSLVT
jgi:hypothetical protein